MANKKDVFVEEIEQLLNETGKNLSEDASAYLEALKNTTEKVKAKFSENGKIILAYMKETKEQYNNLYKAKDFEAAGLTSRGASGAMRKLVADGYVEKCGNNPVFYALTKVGDEVRLEEEEA